MDRVPPFKPVRERITLACRTAPTDRACVCSCHLPPPFPSILSHVPLISLTHLLKSLHPSILFPSSFFTLSLAIFSYFPPSPQERPQPLQWEVTHKAYRKAGKRMGAYIVQQELKRRHTGHTCTQQHFYTPFASDTRILQPDTGDGLDALSRRSEAPCFLSLRRERKREREAHTHT